VQSTTTVITGASSGLGAALARRYARDGAPLALVARDAGRLEAVAESCRALGARVETRILDVRDREAARAALDEIDRRTPIGRVIANAGLNGGDAAGGLESEAVAYAVVETNLLGALHVVLPCIPAMRARGRGQLAFVSSLAAFAPLPDAPAYSGAKAALVAHGLALREKLRGTGVTVNVVCPGYIKTPMGESYAEGWRPLEMSAERAAEHVVRGLARDRDVIEFPKLLAAGARGASLLPEVLRRLGMSGFKFKIRTPLG
jgi:short-subunit dehydrogenase